MSNKMTAMCGVEITGWGDCSMNCDDCWVNQPDTQTAPTEDSEYHDHYAGTCEAAGWCSGNCDGCPSQHPEDGYALEYPVA